MLYMRLRLPELEFNSCEPLRPLEFLALGVTWECPPVPLLQHEDTTNWHISTCHRSLSIGNHILQSEAQHWQVLHLSKVIQFAWQIDQA
jgi:hypothetical protein